MAVFGLPRLKLIPDWRPVATKAWSVRLLGAAVICSGLEKGFDYVGPFLPLSPWWLGFLAFAFTALALVARFMAQRDMGDE